MIGLRAISGVHISGHLRGPRSAHPNIAGAGTRRPTPMPMYMFAAIAGRCGGGTQVRQSQVDDTPHLS